MPENSRSSCCIEYQFQRPGQDPGARPTNHTEITPCDKPARLSGAGLYRDKYATRVFERLVQGGVPVDAAYDFVQRAESLIDSEIAAGRTPEDVAMVMLATHEVASVFVRRVSRTPMVMVMRRPIRARGRTPRRGRRAVRRVARAASSAGAGADGPAPIVAGRSGASASVSIAASRAGLACALVGSCDSVEDESDARVGVATDAGLAPARSAQ